MGIASLVCQGSCGQSAGLWRRRSPQCVTVDRIDAGSGYVYLTLAGPLADLFPNPTGAGGGLYGIENGYVLASVPIASRMRSRHQSAAAPIYETRA